MNTTLKRRARSTEEERYGGYQNQPTVNFGNFEPSRNNAFSYESFSDFGNPRPNYSQDSFTVAQRVAASESRNNFNSDPSVRHITFNEPILSGSNSVSTSELVFSSPAYSKIPAVQPEYIGDRTAQELREYSKEKASKRRSSEQLMPLVTKRQKQEKTQRLEKISTAPVVTEAVESTEQTATSPRTGFKLSQKSMLAVYIAIVVAVAIAIIATGIAIGTAQSRTADLENQLIEQRHELAVAEAELARLLDPDYLAFRAGQDGFVPNADSYISEFPLLELQDTPEFIPPTNWFDALSRFISGLF